METALADLLKNGDIYEAITAALPERRMDYDDAAAIVHSLNNAGYKIVKKEQTHDQDCI